ncbi:glycosyltransferase [candidate division WWE3 bacterium]|nr:glycosyltransferase [candidate division WWE3 bacterium]
MENDLILTIGIPSYSRKESLDALLGQLSQEKAEGFVVLVSEDNSPEDISSVVKKYDGKIKNLIYSKNPQNLGYSGNVFRLYELTKTRYLWFLCNDDSINPGAVGEVIKKLRELEPVVAVFNTTWIDSYGRKRIAGPKETIIHDNFNTFTNYDALMRLTFVSIVVLEKRLPLEQIKYTDYKDNVFVQITIALQLLSDRFRFIEIPSIVLHRNVGYKYGDFLKFYLADELKAIHILKHKFDTKRFKAWFIKRLPSAALLFLSQKIGLFNYTNKPTRKNLQFIFEYYGVYSILIFLFYLISFLIPAFVLKIVYYLILVSIHGPKKAREVYLANIDRAFTDKRKTGFISYR